jgi:hypothetical protein
VSVRRAWLALMLAVLSVACGARTSVDRLDVLLALLPDGTLEVQETWVVRFGKAATSFTRELSGSHHDGLSHVQASVDGRLVSERPGVEKAAVRLGRRPEIIWVIPSITNGTRTFQLRYRAVRALSLSGTRARLEWPVLEPGHGWRIGEAHLVVTAPAGVTVMPPAGVGETGWTVAERPDGISADKNSLGPSESVTAILELGREGLSIEEPAWQYAAERADEFMPAFASAAVFLGVVGVSVLIMIRIMLPPGRADALAGQTTRFDGNPRSLDPEVQHVLRAGGRSLWWRNSLFVFLIGAGLADKGRVAAADGLRAAGLVLAPLGVVLAIVVNWMLWSFGPWAMSVPGSVVAVGVLFLVAAARLRTLTTAGDAVKAQIQ